MRVYDPLMKYLDECGLQTVTLTYSEIEKVDEIYSSPIGYQYVVTITIYVDGNMSTFDSHHIADNLEKNIEGLDKIAKAIIHVNPI